MIINHGFIKNKLKIIYNNTIFFNQRYGGISRYYDSIFKIFIQKKIEFKVISPIYKNIYLKNLSHKFKTGIYIPRYPMSKIIKKFNNTLSYKLINKCKYEILHDTYYTPSLSKIKNKKKILTIHDLIHEKLNHYYHFKDLINYKKKIFENIDNFICVSNTTKEDFLNIYKISEEKVKVIYHGSDHLDSIKINKNNKKFKFKDALNKPFILYVGNRNKYKNFEILINSFKNSAELNDNFNIVCFGGEKISKKELQKYYDFNLNSKIFHINGDDEILKFLYMSAKVLVSTSTHEGFGLNILEAMRYGCPVVVNDIKVFKEIFGHKAIYFNNSDSLIHSLVEILVNQRNIDDLKENCINLAKKFKWEDTTKKTIEVYKLI